MGSPPLCARDPVDRQLAGSLTARLTFRPHTRDIFLVMNFAGPRKQAALLLPCLPRPPPPAGSQARQVSWSQVTSTKGLGQLGFHRMTHKSSPVQRLGGQDKVWAAGSFWRPWCPWGSGPPPPSPSVTMGFSLPLCPNFPLTRTLASALGLPDSRATSL